MFMKQYSPRQKRKTQLKNLISEANLETSQGKQGIRVRKANVHRQRPELVNLLTKNSVNGEILKHREKAKAKEDVIRAIITNKPKGFAVKVVND